MRKIAVLLGLCPLLAELFLGKRNAIIARLTLLAQTYMGTVEVSLPTQEIEFRFPINLIDISQNNLTGIVRFYLKNKSGWRCDFGNSRKPTYGEFNPTTARFSHYYKKLDYRTEGQQIADMTRIYAKDLTPGMHLEFEKRTMGEVRVSTAFLALEDHFVTLTKEIES
jgi:hypothetical protein